MRINKRSALKLWEEQYGNAICTKDFCGNPMFKYAYGKRRQNGWNIHHILPKAIGGTNKKHNLICTNIITNDTAANKTTYWINNTCFQVQKVHGSSKHTIKNVTNV